MTIDSRSVSYIRKTPSELDDYMTSVNSNVKTFIEFVRPQIVDLTATGKISHHVVLNLFKV